MKYIYPLKIGLSNCQWPLYLSQTICLVRKLSKSLGLQNTSSMFKIGSVRSPLLESPSRQPFFGSRTSQWVILRKELLFRLRHDEKRTVKYYEETFRLPWSTAARWENKQWTFSGPGPARGGKRERALFIFSRLRALLGSLQGPSVGNVTRRSAERTLFTAANSWTSRDCES